MVAAALVLLVVMLYQKMAALVAMDCHLVLLEHLSPVLVEAAEPQELAVAQEGQEDKVAVARVLLVVLAQAAKSILAVAAVVQIVLDPLGPAVPAS